MAKKLSFIGYIKEPFDYYCKDDELLIKSLQSIRNDNLRICHWNSIDNNLYSDKAFDICKKQYLKYNLQDSDVIIFLEMPHEKSKSVSKKKVTKLLDIMNSSLSIPTINPIKSFLDFPDKSYMLDFPELPLPKTFEANKDAGLNEILSNLGEEIVIKPFDGGGGFGVKKLKNDLNLVKNTIGDERYLIQEFIPDVKYGEKSLVFFNKKFKYAVLKKSREGEFKNNLEYCEKVSKYTPTELEINIAKNALATLKSPSILERVDMVGSKIMEFTMECPGLYIEFAGVEKEIGKWFYQLIDNL